jgi:hypothetical protein
MLNKFSIVDKLLLAAALLSLIYSEVMFFRGDTNAAIFVGLWVPSIIGFGIYLNLLKNKKHD